ncbi:MAG: hypothetical protein PHY59_04320 [Methanobacterium sp.]|nr:hypothetical protein [Methanobacterium sp.]
MMEPHRELDGEIVPVGEPFCNGLMYPGDEFGPVDEGVNYSHTFVPFIRKLNEDIIRVGMNIPEYYVYAWSCSKLGISMKSRNGYE